MINVEVGNTPSKTIYTENKLKLLRYESSSEKQNHSPILFVSAIINKPYILDLQPNRSVVKQFLKRGFDVYLIDWGEPSILDTNLGLNDYVNRYLSNCIDIINKKYKDSVNLFGYCTGATLSTIYSTLYPKTVNTLILLASVLNFDTEEGVSKLWTNEGYYDPKTLIDVFGNAPGELLSFEFSLMDPLKYNLNRYIRLYENLEDREYIQNRTRRLRWGFESVDVPGQLYLDFLLDLYRENKLIKGSLYLDGQNIDIDNLDIPILNIIGTEDNFVPSMASIPFLKAIPHKDKNTIKFPANHVGLSISKKAHQKLWPKVCEWLKDHQKSKT